MRMKDFLLPGGIFFAGLVLGLLFELFILQRLKALARRTKWEGDEVIVRAFQGWTAVLGAVLGFYIALFWVPFTTATLHIIHRVLMVVTILVVTVILARMAGGFINIYGEKGRGVLPAGTIFANLSKAIVFILGGLVIINSLGISITPIITTLGLGGLAVALALQDTLANFFAGLHLLLARQIKPGDYIKLENGEEGFVVDVTWRTTTIRQWSNNMVVVPNAKLASAIVINYELPGKEMTVPVPLSVSYDSDLEKVEAVTLAVAREVMREVAGGVADAEPILRYQAFGDSGIQLSVFLRVQEAMYQFAVRHEFIKRLHRRYKEEGIVIPFPMRTVYLKDEREGENG